MRRRYRSNGKAPFALALIGFGLVALAFGQLAGPSRRLALYDGVVVEDPYRYVAPASGQEGNPDTGESVNAVTGSTSPAVVVSTAENPPQAQLIAPTGAFDVSSSATSLTGTLTPLAPTSAQTQAGAVGNVYRISVTDQNQQPVPMTSGAQATVILRAPSTSSTQVAVALWNGTAFQVLPTITGNQADLLKAQATELGDYALVPGPSSGPGPGLLFLAGVLLLVVALVGALFLWRRRATPVAVQPASARRTKPAAPAAPRPNKARKRGKQ